MKLSLSVLVAAAAVLIAGAAEARTGYVKTADGKCHYCDTGKTPMCTALPNDSLCKKYSSKSLVKINPANPFGDQPDGDQSNVGATDRPAASPSPD